MIKRLLTKNVPKPAMLVMALGMCLVTEARATVSYLISNPGSASTSSGYADLQMVNISIDNTVINNAFAGGIMITAQGTGTPLGAPTSYTTICTDISGTVYLGDTYQYNIPLPFANLANGVKPTGVDPTWGALNGPGIQVNNTGNALQAIQNAAYLFYTFGGLNSGGITGSADQMAGLQLAVWEALYDTTASGQVVANTGTSVVSSSARFQVLAGGDAAAIADANSYLASLNSQVNAGSFGYTGDLLVPDPATPTNGSPYLNANYDNQPPQELLFGVNDPQGGSMIPEPSTVFAGAMLLLPFGASTLQVLRKRLTA